MIDDRKLRLDKPVHYGCYVLSGMCLQRADHHRKGDHDNSWTDVNNEVFELFRP
jgi:hypothetical protein